MPTSVMPRTGSFIRWVMFMRSVSPGGMLRMPAGTDIWCNRPALVPFCLPNESKISQHRVSTGACFTLFVVHCISIHN